MRKYSIVLMLIMVLVLSAGVNAIDYYTTAEEAYEDMLNTAETKPAGTGKGKYVMENVLDYNDGDKLDSLTHNLELEYGIYEGGEIEGNIYFYEFNDNIYGECSGNLKHRLTEINDWVISGELGYYYRDYFGMKTEGPWVGMLTNKRIENIVLHNNLIISFIEESFNEHIENDLYYGVVNGLTYNINDKTTFKANLSSQIGAKSSNLSYQNLELGIQTVLNEKLTYTAYVDTKIKNIINDTNDKNIKISNTVKYRMGSGLTLTGDFLLNTGDDNNKFYTSLEKEFPNKVTIGGEFCKVLNEENKELIFNIKQEHEKGFYILGQYYNNLDNRQKINLGVGQVL